MKRLSGRGHLVFVTSGDSERQPSLADTAEDAVLGGASIVIFREQALPDSAFQRLAESVMTRVRCAGGVFMINERIDCAIAIGADGVQLTARNSADQIAAALAQDWIIGRSIHSAREAVEVMMASSFLLMGTVFPTPSKSPVTPWLGPQGLRSVVEQAQLPVVGIGGINAKNAGLLTETGVAGIAVVRALSQALDVQNAARELARVFRLGK